MPAKRGRPRKPTALKKVHNAGKRPLNDAEPEGPALGAEAPAASNIVQLAASRDECVGAIRKERGTGARHRDRAWALE